MFDHIAQYSHDGGSVVPAPGARSLVTRSRVGRVRAGRIAAIALAVSALAANVAGAAGADPQGDASRYSHTGFKGAITYGSMHASSKLHLDDASSVGLALGYGIDPHFSLWFGLNGSEHERDQAGADRKRKTALATMDLTVQYRFIPVGAVQPYGKIGFGGSVLEETDTHNAKAGNTLSLGIGADYFFSRHFGIGAEATYRSLRFSQERTGEKGDFREMAKDLDGDAAGIAVSFTVQ